MESKQQHRNEGISSGRGWRTFVMLAGSALLGGTAVALWNRRLLAEIRENARQNPEPDRDDIVESGDDA